MGRHGLASPDARSIARVPALFAVEPDPTARRQPSPGESPGVASSILGTGSGGGIGLLPPLAPLFALALGLGSVTIRGRVGGAER